MIKNAFSSLYRYCRKANYKGWDLFDGLNSRLLQNTSLFKSKIIRLFSIQLFKRSPINLRSLALVTKGYNPKGLGLFASGLIGLNKLDESKTLLHLLKEMRCNGFEGVSWGYNFPWQARAFYVPIGKPNMVTTVFVANAFLDYFEKTDEKEALQIARGACEFILKTLILFEDNDTLCFGYIPGESVRIHNANMLGAALLARIYYHSKELVFYKKSKKAMAYSINALKPDYSWQYGERHHHQFVDNFHTGFNLVALKDWIDFTGDYEWEEKLKKAYNYFTKTFWLEDGCPKYYNNSLFPIDIHCSAQGIVTCLRLSRFDKLSVPSAEKIAAWAIQNMQDKKGYFYYQKTKWYTNRIPYIRWSQAWMFYALSLYLSKTSISEKNPKN